MRINISSLLRLLSIVVVSAATTACVQQQVISANTQPVAVATEEIPEDELLDIGVHLFDPGYPESEEKQRDEHAYPEVRKAEARYMAYHMKSTLEHTGNWGAVRVTPTDTLAVDVQLQGTIIHSDGELLEVEVTVFDSTGRKWFTNRYKDTASKYAYSKYVPTEGDPFQDMYNSVANDMLAYRQKMASEDVLAIRRVSELKFAADLSPYAFSEYLSRDRRGLYVVNRLPADGDPMMDRMQKVRQREYLLIDTMDEYYANFYRGIEDSYNNWRTYTYDEAIAQRELERSARNRMIAGAAMVIAGVLADQKAESRAARTVGTGAAIGGVALFKSGWDRKKEAQIHIEAINELSESMQAEVAPMVVEVEGQVVELNGSAEQQFDEWRRLLQEIYSAETGLVVESQGGENAEPANN